MRKFAAKLAVIAGLILLFSFSAAAQDDSKFQVDGGFLYGRAINSQFSDNCYGGYGNATYFLTSAFGLTADFGGCSFSGLPAGESANEFEYVFGPTVAWRKTKVVEPFVQALFGGGRFSGSGNGESIAINAFAMNIGGGVDVAVSKTVAIRVIQVNWAYAHANGGNENAVELKFGVTLRFGGS